MQRIFKLTVAVVALLSAPFIFAQKPAEFEQALPGVVMQKRGTTTLKVLLFKVYDATLWTAEERVNPLGGNQPYALDITYSMKLSKDELVKSSMDEIIRLRNPAPAVVEKWTVALRAAFPAVVPSDRLLGVATPGKGVRFFHNGKLTSEIADQEFANAFFAIWLDPQTRKPEVRNALLQ